MMILSMLIISLMIPTEAYKAYEASLSVGVSASTVKIGDTVTVTVKVPGAVSGPVSLYFPTDVMEYVSTSTEASVVGGTIQFSIGKGGRAASDTVTVKLKTKTTGSATLKVEATGDIYDYDSLEEVVLKGASTKVTVENQTTTPPDSGNEGGGDTTPEPQKSGDNSLASLKLSSGTLSPSFKYNVTKYTATVGYDVDKVVVSAKTSNEKATIESVTDDGNVNLKVGENTIKIVVKAENGVKATYTIVVTRKAQETPVEPQPSDSEEPSGSDSEPTPPEVNEFLQYNGEQLSLVEDIPAERIPAGFESKLLVVNGQQMQGLSFTKGELKLLYLNNTNGAASLYVYDEAQQMIYPFIKLSSEHSYVMVLIPNEQEAPVPAGFESCTFSIEGKGTVNAYQMKEEVEETTSWNPFAPEIFLASPAQASEFYLMYCMNGEGEKGWYMYDVVEETYMRYFAATPSIPVGGEVSDDSDLQDKYDAVVKELNASKMTQYIIMGGEAAVILILVIVLIVLIVKNRRPEEDFFDGYEEEDDYDDEEEKTEEGNDEEDGFEPVYAPHGKVVTDAIAKETVEMEPEVEENDDEIEIEFYEMEAEVEENSEENDDEIEIEFYEMEPEVEENEVEENDDEIEIEFYEMEELIVSETIETEEKLIKEQHEKTEPEVETKPVEEEKPEVETKPVEEVKIIRRPRVKDRTSKYSSKKEDDDDDLEFIDFE